MLAEEVAALVTTHTAAEYATDWNRDGLAQQLQALVPTIETDALRAIEEVNDADQLSALLADASGEAYDRKRTELGAEGATVLERLVLLRVIDTLWVEHLTAIDDMRRGIGLRAYSQRDPLNEFKVEAYRMFDELKSTIRHDVTHTIFRVTVQREQQPAASRPLARNVTEGRAAVPGSGDEVPATTATASGTGNGSAPAKAGPKVGRNDPCWCGSGKKYKRCHGA
jgi:preprotein translocase subunit SecA